MQKHVSLDPILLLAVSSPVPGRKQSRVERMVKHEPPFSFNDI